MDDYIADLVPLLARAALCAISQAGWGFAYDFRRRVYSAILLQAAERAKAWDDRLLEFHARLADEAALPATATEEERIASLAPSRPCHRSRPDQRARQRGGLPHGTGDGEIARLQREARRVGRE